MRVRAMLTVAALAAATAAVPAAGAQPLEHERGKILSIDRNALKVELSDAQGRVLTRSFARDATVKFTDGARFFANPSIHDLRPPMYVHYMFRNDVIEVFDVVELGFDPAASAPEGQGVARTVVGRVTAYDAKVRQVELEHDGKRETFQLTDRSNRQLEPGTQVRVRTEWSGPRELVVELQPLAGGAAGGSAEGRVVRVGPRAALIEVEGRRDSYLVAQPSLLKRLTAGTTARFSWVEKNGRRVITEVY